MPEAPTDLGDLAVSMGWITREVLEEALRLQKEAAASGQAPRIGQVLVDRGHLTTAQLRALLTLQGKGIVACPGCKRQYNVSSFRIGAQAKCPGCGSLIAVDAAPVSDLAVEGTVVLAPEDGEGAKADVLVAEAAQEAAAVPKSFGKYQVIDEIARGGMGIVYRATEMGLGRKVAIKVLIAGEEAGQDQIDRFIREARAAAKLRHPNIVAIHDIGVEHGHHFFTMDLIEGCALEHLLRERIAITPTDALRIARDVAYALHYAHQHSIIHRDLKPGNVLLEFSGGPRPLPRGEKGSDAVSRFTEGEVPAARTGLFSLHPEDRVYLTDFGLAKDVGSESTRLTRTGMTMGTPAYMSPEQARGRIEEVDGRSDVFSLGAVLYEMVTGRPPFRGDSIIDVMMKVATRDPIPMRHLNPSIHPDIETICMKALEKDKARRYANALALAADIESCLGGEAISARPQGLAFRARRAMRRNAALVAAVSLTAIAISLAFLIPTQVKPWFDRRAAGQARQAAEAKRLAAEQKLESDARQLVAQARTFEGEGRLTEAIGCVTSVVVDTRSPPVVPEAYFVGGEVQARLDAGQTFASVANDAAYRYFALAYAAGAGTDWGPRSLLAIGTRLAERHDHARAVTVLQKLLQRYPNAREVTAARVALAHALAATGRPDLGGAILSADDPPPETSSLRALLAPFGALAKDSLGAPFSRATVCGEGQATRLFLAREGEMLSVHWAGSGGIQAERSPIPEGTVLDLLTDGREASAIAQRPDGTLAIFTRDGRSTPLDLSWQWWGGGAACADLDGDGTPELYLPIGRHGASIARMEPGHVAEGLGGIDVPADTSSIDLVPFAPYGGGANAIVVACRSPGRAVVRVLQGGKGAPVESDGMEVEGFLGAGTAAGEVITVAARAGRAVVLPLSWDGKSLKRESAISTDVRADVEGAASVALLPGTPPPVLVRLEGGGAGENAIVLVKRPRGSDAEVLEVGARPGGGPVFRIGDRLAWMESQGSTLVSGLAGGKTAAPLLPPLPAAPTELERAQDLIDLGLPDDALTIAEKNLADLRKAWDGSATSRPIAEADLVVARAHAARGDLDRAFEALDEAGRASAQDLPRALRLRADLLLAAGKKDLAARALEGLLLEGRLPQSDADRVRGELERVSAWGRMRTLVDARFSTGGATALRGALLATDPLRVRLGSAGLSLRQSLRHPVAAGVPLFLDGRSFEATATLSLPAPTAGARVEWGLFNERAGWDLVAGACAEGPGQPTPEGYRWQARVVGTAEREEFGRWSPSVAPKARLTLSYESETRRVDLRVEMGQGGLSTLLWSADLSSDFPAGECCLGARISAAPSERQQGAVDLDDVSLRVETLVSSVQATTGPEAACGLASLGQTEKALQQLESVARPPVGTGAFRIALLALAGDAKRLASEAANAASDPATQRALEDLLPALPSDAARAVIERLSAAWARRSETERRAAAREAMHSGDALSAAAALHSLAAAKGVDAESVCEYASALLLVGQHALAAEQAARVVLHDQEVRDATAAQRDAMVLLLWRCWARTPSDEKLAEVLAHTRPFPVAWVEEVDAASPAGLAKIRPGDVITAVDGGVTHLAEEVLSRYEAAICAAHGSVDLTLTREGKEVHVHLPMGPLGIRMVDRLVGGGGR